MDESVTQKILDFEIDWPICNYSLNSRRLREPTVEQPKNIEDMLVCLNDWHLHNEIAIDGMNGVGKSFLTQNLNRTYAKINDFIPEVTCGSEYNYNIFKSMQYVTLQLCITGDNVIWDRCAYSNLIFYFVHYLMGRFQNKLIPAEHENILSILNELAIDINLTTMLTYLKSIKEVPTLFIVCSDLNIIGLALVKRQTLNDIWNAKDYNYQMAQYHSYMYFAKILQYPILDIADFIDFGISLGDLQMAIARKIDSPNVKRSYFNQPNTQSAKELHNQLGRLADNILMYDHSKK